MRNDLGPTDSCISQSPLYVVRRHRFRSWVCVSGRVFGPIKEITPTSQPMWTISERTALAQSETKKYCLPALLRRRGQHLVFGG